MKNSVDGLATRLDLAEERISELEGISTESSKTEKQREQKLEKRMLGMREREVGAFLGKTQNLDRKS